MFACCFFRLETHISKYIDNCTLIAHGNAARPCSAQQIQQYTWYDVYIYTFLTVCFEQTRRKIINPLYAHTGGRVT